MLAGKEPSRPSEAGKDLVGNQERSIAVTELADLYQAFRRPQDHSPCALEYRLNDHGRHLVTFTLENFFEASIAGGLEACSRSGIPGFLPGAVKSSYGEEKVGEVGMEYG